MRLVRLLGFLAIGVPLAAVQPQLQPSVAALALSAHATQACGEISSDTAWTADQAPYSLTCSVTVDNGVTLTIEPGVTVYASSGVELDVIGTLVANGTQQSRIVFSCSASPCADSYWKGINFEPYVLGQPTGNSVSYANISGAAIALQGEPGPSLVGLKLSNDNTGIEAHGTNLDLQSDEISTTGDSVSVTGSQNLGDLALTDSTISETGSGNGSAVSVTGDWPRKLTITNSTISSPSWAVDLFDRDGVNGTSTLSITASTINGGVGASASNVGLTTSTIKSNGSGLSVDGTGGVSVGTSEISIDPSAAAASASSAISVGDEKLYVFNSILSGGQGTGVSVGSDTATYLGGSLIMEKTRVQGSHIGVSIQRAGDSEITNSTITGNTVGIFFSAGSTASFDIQNSDIYMNSLWNLAQASDASETTIDANGNYWGLNDLTAVKSTIQDCATDSTLRCVQLQTLLASPCGAACSDVTPAPTATPTPTPTSTPTPTGLPPYTQTELALPTSSWPLTLSGKMNTIDLTAKLPAGSCNLNPKDTTLLPSLVGGSGMPVGGAACLAGPTAPAAGILQWSDFYLPYSAVRERAGYSISIYADSATASAADTELANLLIASRLGARDFTGCKLGTDACLIVDTTQEKGLHYSQIYEYWRSGRVLVDVDIALFYYYPSNETAWSQDYVAPIRLLMPKLVGAVDGHVKELLAGSHAGSAKWSVASVKIGYRSSNSNNVLKRASLARLKVGQNVKLYVFAAFSGLTATLPVSVGFRVTSHAGTTIFYKKLSLSVGPSENGLTTSWSAYFTPRAVGQDSLSGTLFVASGHKHKSVGFQVVRSP